MGTINYKSSKYITLVTREYDIKDFLEDSFFVGCCVENGYTDITAAAYDEIDRYIQDDFENAQNVLDKYDFEYYTLKIDPGYYFGYQLIIENNIDTCYDDYYSKCAARDEIKNIAYVLRCLAGCGWCACSVGWCTSYFGGYDTERAIKRACAELRKENRDIPCYSTLLKRGEN